MDRWKRTFSAHVAASLNVPQGPGPQAESLPSDDPSQSTHQAQNLLKSAIYADEQTGPCSEHMAGMVSGLDKLLADNRSNRKNHPWPYWLNPFVSSPIGKMMPRAQRRRLVGAGKDMLGVDHAGGFRPRGSRGWRSG